MAHRRVILLAKRTVEAKRSRYPPAQERPLRQESTPEVVLHPTTQRVQRSAPIFMPQIASTGWLAACARAEPPRSQAGWRRRLSCCGMPGQNRWTRMPETPASALTPRRRRPPYATACQRLPATPLASTGRTVVTMSRKATWNSPWPKPWTSNAGINTARPGVAATPPSPAAMAKHPIMASVHDPTRRATRPASGEASTIPTAADATTKPISGGANLPIRAR